MVAILYENIKEIPDVEKIIEAVVERVYKTEKTRPNFVVYITLTNNEKIKEINKKHRKIDAPTDVLSFPMYTREELEKKKGFKLPKEILGDIIISIEKVEEQAKEYGHSFERELAYMVVHGMLHLLGYDHIEQDDQIEMRKKEEDILGYLNITR